MDKKLSLCIGCPQLSTNSYHCLKTNCGFHFSVFASFHSSKSFSPHFFPERWQQTRAGPLLFSLSYPAAWLDGAIWIGQAQRRDAGSSFGSATLFRLGLYLFRCKSARGECYVLSLCSGRRTGAHLLEEVSPTEIGAVQIVLHYKAVIDVREADIMLPHPSRRARWEKSPHTHFLFLLLSTAMMQNFSSRFHWYEAVSGVSIQDRNMRQRWTGWVANEPIIASDVEQQQHEITSYCTIEIWYNMNTRVTRKVQILVGMRTFLWMFCMFSLCLFIQVLQLPSTVQKTHTEVD